MLGGEKCLEKRLGWQHRWPGSPCPRLPDPRHSALCSPWGTRLQPGNINVLMGRKPGCPPPPRSLQHRHRNKAAVLVGGWPPRAKGGGSWKFGGKKGCREGLAPSPPSAPFPSRPLRPAGLN